MILSGRRAPHSGKHQFVLKLKCIIFEFIVEERQFCYRTLLCLAVFCKAMSFKMGCNDVLTE